MPSTRKSFVLLRMLGSWRKGSNGELHGGAAVWQVVLSRRCVTGLPRTSWMAGSGSMAQGS